MRRVYDISLIVLFIGILIAGGGLGTGSTLAFQIGAVLVVVAVIGVLVYAFRPRSRR